jgi:predicted transcriptional regulator
MHASTIINAHEIDLYDTLQFALGLKKLDIKIYTALLRKGSKYTKQISDELGISYARARDSLARLYEKGVIDCEEDFIGLGGYKHLYTANPTEHLKAITINNLEIGYNGMLENAQDIADEIS